MAEVVTVIRKTYDLLVSLLPLRGSKHVEAYDF
jgi:hypothetical protein